MAADEGNLNVNINYGKMKSVLRKQITCHILEKGVIGLDHNKLKIKQFEAQFFLSVLSDLWKSG